MIIRIILFLTTFFISFLVNAQNNRDPAYYLNGTSINFNKIFINPSRVDSFSIDRKTKDGEINIFTKNRAFTFLTLKEVLMKYTKLTNLNDSLLFMINGKVVDDVFENKIDDTFFIYVDIKTLSNVKYLYSKFQNLTIVDIELKKEPKPIMIRGNNALLSQISK